MNSPPFASQSPRLAVLSSSQIILSVAEHHSNLVPWQMVAEKTGAVLKHVGLTPQQELDMDVSLRPGAFDGERQRQQGSDCTRLASQRLWR
jgi:selenocysteine lyase/cysteine desulfurase